MPVLELEEVELAPEIQTSGSGDCGPGTCKFCGCTDARACIGGCWWIDDEHTVCSSKVCVDKFFATHRERVDRMMEHLRQEHER